MTRIKLAARGGHLELCKFLLQSSSHFRDDSIIREAVGAFVAQSRGRGIGVYLQSLQEEMNGLYDLFFGRYGLTAEFAQSERLCIGDFESVESNMMLTEFSLRSMWASQVMSPMRWSFKERFTLAMQSEGWPATSFMDLLHPGNLDRIATERDCLGRTALHWAAEHLGYWEFTHWVRDVSPEETQLEGYAKLIEHLLRIGADPHAISNQEHTPLDSIVVQTNFRGLRDYKWVDCSRAVKRWGRIICESGLSLHDYVHVENRLQNKVLSRLATPNTHSRNGLHLHSFQVILLNESELALRVKYHQALEIWELRLPPGSWPEFSLVPNQIFWGPWESEVSMDFWELVRKVGTVPATCILQHVPETERPFYEAIDLEAMYCDLLRRGQDDHGFAFRMGVRSRERSNRLGQPPRRRASSTPPPSTLPICHTPPGSFAYDVHVMSAFGQAHKCFADGQWITTTPFWSNDRLDIRRMCMLGLCHDGPELNLGEPRDWRTELFLDKDKAHLGREFARRFHPEAIPVIDTSVEKAQRLAQLEQEMAHDVASV